MNSFAWFMPARHDYRLVAGDSDGIRWSAQASTAYPIRKLLLKTALICLLVVSSFLAGQLSIPVPKAERDKAIPLETKDELFRYNRTFAGPPSEVTDAAWDSLFPTHGGFFVHPELAPKRSALSVFHQLHCLDGLRHGFYALHEQAMEHSEMTSHQKRRQSDRAKRGEHDHSMGHIQHCLDLLRQSLMCNADLTVELKNEELGGVTGFGTVHQCVDWPALLEWIRPYEKIGAPPA